MTVSPVSNQNNIPVVTGAVVGAAGGAAMVAKGLPIFSKNFNAAKDVYVSKAMEKNFDRLVDSGITKRSYISKALVKVAQKARQDFSNTHKIQGGINKLAELAKNHKVAAIAIGAAVLATAGALIGKAIANKNNKE